jgi:predicted nucleotidyltransferase
MVTRDQIQEYVDRIVERFRPSKVILFGSYAHGKPTEDSDVDLMVIFRRGPAGTRKAIDIRRHCRAPFPMDLLTCTDSRVHQRLRWHDFFTMDIIEKGAVLYDASAEGVAA